jgi:hypothetical protein
MVQSECIPCYDSNAGFGRSGVQTSSFKAWPTFVLHRYFKSSESEDPASLRKPKEVDPNPKINQKGRDELKRREQFQELIERAYAESVARRVNL